VAPGQPLLDRPLALDQPVHGRVELVLVGIGDAQVLADVVSVKARVMPSLLASGATIRSATIATMRSRSREGRASMSFAKPSSEVPHRKRGRERGNGRWNGDFCASAFGCRAGS
jgi:hypothetical protein